MNGGARGAVHTWRFSGGSWSNEEKLVASNGRVNDFFGNDVALDGQTLLVGAYSREVSSQSFAGAVYVFEDNSTTLSEVQYLESPDPGPNGWFGYRVDIEGTTAAISAPGEGSGYAGRVYVYELSGGSWTLAAGMPLEIDGSFSLGASLHLNGQLIVAGASSERVNGINGAGAAYIFTNQFGPWSYVKRLTAFDPRVNQGFGTSVVALGDRIVVGADFDSTPTQSYRGAGYAFSKSLYGPNGWGGLEGDLFKLADPNSAALDHLGTAAAGTHSGGLNIVALSAPGDDNNGNNAGSVLVWVQECGNSVVEWGEECDGTFGCKNSTCLWTCGDGLRDSGEGCDDGNRQDGDFCSSNCTIEVGCGNGIKENMEECDDGNLVDGDNCTSACMLPNCGDGIVDEYEECDDFPFSNNDACLNNCINATCGDGHLWIGVEGCDDGNIVNGDGCSENCILEICGDGVVTLESEECDDNNTISGDGCSDTCYQEFCGDGIVNNVDEECDEASDDCEDCLFSSSGSSHTQAPTLGYCLSTALVVLFFWWSAGSSSEDLL